ncbi:MAG: flagellar basal-body rod protein FlgG [Cyanobacteriota bacterium]
MLRSLSTAATGMIAQQVNIDVISNNLANVNTTGFKKSRAEFQDLLCQTLKAPGAQVNQGTYQPSGIQIGLGVKNSAVQRITTDGIFQSTDNPTSIAISGEGYFQIQMDDGTTAYTRDGNFKIDANGQLVTTDGFQVIPQVTIPQDATEITITAGGKFTVKQPGTAELTEVGTLELVRFPNDAGLLAVGKNLFLETGASGTPVQGIANQEGFGSIEQGFLEGSNVQVVEELINLISAQRAFEANSNVIRASDEALKTVNRIV